MADATAPPTNGSSAPEVQFDYIVVGGGTAGLVVASRLSEDSDVKVLVIEAGGDRSEDPLIVTPGLVAGVYGKKEYDWNFTSPPQPTLNNRTINQSRGRMLGGSSALNFLMAVYPSRGIIDAWGALGNEGWSFEALQPYLRKFATTHEPPKSAREISRMDGHYEAAFTKSETGPLQISFSEGYGATNSAWMDTFAKLGLQMTTDPRSGAAIGAFQNGATIDPVTKARSYAASAYLTPEVRKRENLTVWTDTIVTKIVLVKQDDGDVVAQGVKIRSEDGEEKTISARNEVVLAAGALQSPQLLELSGIGGKELLEKHGIPVVIDNPNVGEHMQDHPIVCQSFEVAPGVTSGDILRDPNILNAVIGQYQATREGPLGQSVISCAFAPLLDSAGPMPTEERQALFDAHLKPLPAGSDAASAATAGRELERKVMRSLLSTTNEPGVQFLLFPTQVPIPEHPKAMSDHLLPTAPENYITVMMMLNHPFSRGSCHIVSSSVDTLPVWEPNYNSEPVDLEILTHGTLFVETLINTEPFASLLKKGGKRMPEISATDLDKAREIVRQRQISVFHVSSSCAMLPKELGGVVDGRLKVYGVKNLRIVDASVFPLEPLGNIQTTVYAVAEKAADLIKEDRKKASA
ncbi:GMC oxidoreductase [Pleurostoma richardsiae]|uniref:GMC oxidoreductase n=1 Tax=Pleurostoma richardsiae TaxID=41990 RepID=A0AA38VBY3_9PEZI|nr:GMC oxidoreductase [Pleurostoma richardsiae]